MLVQVAVAEDATEWFGYVAVLFGTVIGPLVVLGRRWRHGKLRRQGPMRGLRGAADERGVAGAVRSDLVNTIEAEGKESAGYDAEGYPLWLQVQALPDGPPTDFLPEASVGELTALRRAIPASSRARLARKLWQGRWVRWGGEVREVSEQNKLLTIMVVDSRRGFVYLAFPLARRSVVTSLREGDRIAFTGQIRELNDM